MASRRGACGAHRDLVYAGRGPDWSYLLAFTPPSGHYRVDAIAVDGHGNGSAISPGSNRVETISSGPATARSWNCGSGR